MYRSPQNKEVTINAPLTNQPSRRWYRLLLLGAFCLLLAGLLWHSQQEITAVSSAAVANTTDIAAAAPLPQQAVDYTLYLPFISTPFIVEYPLPQANAAPRNIVAESPGRLWFTLPGINAVGSLVVTDSIDFEFTIYTIPTSNSDPHDLVLDTSNEAVWFTQRAADKIARLDMVTGQINEYSFPTGSNPTGIDRASDGLIWVTLPGTNKIASFNPVGNTINEVTYATAGAQFTDVAISSNGLVWAAAPGLNRLVAYNPSNGTLVDVRIGELGSSTTYTPHAMVMQGSTPWVSIPEKNWLGRYSPGTLKLWLWYATYPAASGPTALAHRSVGTSQEFWYVQPSANHAGRMVINNQGDVTSQSIFSLPTANSLPEGIAVASNGHAWVAATNANSIVEFGQP
jgi:streptogramin lyase